MSLHPTLLVRRWPERRPVVLTAAGLGFAALFLAGGPGDRGLGALYVLPVVLAALELGLVGGLVVALGVGGLSVAAGAVAPAVAALATGAIAGRFSDRMCTRASNGSWSPGSRSASWARTTASRRSSPPPR